MRKTFFLLLLATPAGAAIGGAAVTEFTATQAILKYQAPDSSPCSVEVSENPNFQPLVHDVNPAKFTGAGNDNRAGNVLAGAERWFVIGKRAADVGLDGVRYSRALQASTRHYYRITCPGAGNVVSGNFSTMNIQFGNTYEEAQPGDRNRPGELAQPHIGLSDRSEQVIDPQTGLLLKRLSAGNDWATPINGAPFVIARSASWQNTGNVLAQDGKFATSIGTAPLFLAVRTGANASAPYTNYMASWRDPYGGFLGAFGYYQAHLVAAVNTGAAAPTNPEDAKIVACRTVDGVNCDPGSSLYEATLSSSTTDVPFGTTVSGDLWQKTGGMTPSWPLQGTRNGSVKCDGTNSVAYTGGEYFGVHWVTGSNINIGGTDYSVDTVVNTGKLTLTSNCPANGAGAAYTASNFGILVRKKTASQDIISIDYGYVNYELQLNNNFTVGTANLCGTETVAGLGGRPGYNCFTPAGSFYWIDAESGDATLWANASGITPPGICGTSTGNIFDATDPDKFYCAAAGPLYALKYYGDHSARPSGFAIWSNLNQCYTGGGNAPPYRNQQPCYTVTPVTPGTDLPTLTAAFTANPIYAPAYQPAKFGNPMDLEVDVGGNIVMDYTESGQFTMGWVIVFNPAATSNSEGGSSTGAVGNHGCLGNGLPGCIVAAMPSWDRPGCRWCVIKHGVAAAPGWESTEVYGWTGQKLGTGPYQVQLIDGVANGTSSQFNDSSTLGDCPANNYAATGKTCTKVTVSSEPFGPRDALNTGLPGEFGPAKVGDYFSLVVNLPSSPAEQMRLIAKDPGVAAGTWVYTLQRRINGYGLSSSAPNPLLYLLCNANQTPARTYAGSPWMWNWADDPHGMNADGRSIPKDNTAFNGHTFWSNGAWAAVEIPAIDPRCYNRQCYATRIPDGRNFYDVVTQPAPTAMITSAPRFGGSAAVDESNLQSHVTNGGAMASPDRFPFMFDGRPYRGGYSSGSPDGAGPSGMGGSHPATLIAGQLYRFHAADLAAIDLPYPKTYPLAAFTGRYPLINISGPAQGDILGSSVADSYKYCLASVAGECRAGSIVGDLYVNAPHVNYPYCVNSAQNGNLPNDQDICIAGSPNNRDAIVQIGMTATDLTGTNQRVLTKFVAPRVISPFWTPILIPNGKWMIFEAQFTGDGSANKALMLAKIPPPDQQFTIDRRSFVPITLRIPAHEGATAFVRFGYSENGDMGTFYCTSRQENCVAANQGQQSIDVANPFYFEQTEAASNQPVDCNAGCQISLPGIPQRVLYYQIVFNTAGAMSQTPVLATVVP